MRRLGVVLTVLSLTLAVAPAAMGDFSTPPEDNAAISWQTAPPYQRNMTLDFAQHPEGPVGPGIPGATYIGYDDPVLWKSDYVELIGPAVTWNPDLGAVGIFNGQSGDIGEIVVRFDNWDRDWLLKHVYVEYTYEVTDPTGNLFTLPSLDLPENYAMVDTWSNISGLSPWRARVQLWAEIEPNPPWEELSITLVGLAPGSIYITDLQIATECVPVPGATLLALLGLGAAGVKLRRFV